GGLCISIHAPNTGSDSGSLFACYRLPLFQSTLPIQGATVQGITSGIPTTNFNPRSQYRERPSVSTLVYSCSDFNPRSQYRERRRLSDSVCANVDFNPRSQYRERRSTGRV